MIQPLLSMRPVGQTQRLLRPAVRFGADSGKDQVHIVRGEPVDPQSLTFDSIFSIYLCAKHDRTLDLASLANFQRQLKALSEELSPDAAKAKVAMEADIQHLQRLYRAKKNLPNGGIGLAAYQELLRAEGIDLDPQQLIAMMEQEYQRLERRMNRLAKQVNPNANWLEVYEQARQQHPGASGLLPAYRQSAKALRQFLKDKKLVTLPGKRFKVVKTPMAKRKTYGMAFYSSGTKQVSVTPFISKEKTEQLKELQEHNHAAIHVIMAHEAIPGHHQHYVARDKARAANANFTNDRYVEQVQSWFKKSGFFVEGWALYGEKLLIDQGYYQTPQAQIVAMRSLLWRAARAFLNSKIHTGQMTLAEASQFMQQHLGMTPAQADSEVRGHISGNLEKSTQKASYYLGMLQIEQLRRQVAQKEPGMTLQTFHDRLLHGEMATVSEVAKERFDVDLALIQSA